MLFGVDNINFKLGFEVMLFCISAGMESFLWLLLIIAITLPVLVLSGVVGKRFKARSNSTESTTGKVVYSSADLLNKDYCHRTEREIGG